MIIKLNKSIKLTVLLAAVFGGAGFLVLTIDGPLWILMPVFVFMLVLGRRHINRFAWLSSKDSIIAMSLKNDVIQVAIAQNSERYFDCVIHSKFISRHVLVLTLAEDDERANKRRLIIVRGMCTDDELRKLKKYCLLYVNEDARTAAS